MWSFIALYVQEGDFTIYLGSRGEPSKIVTFFFKLRQIASMGGFCMMVGRMVGWLVVGKKCGKFPIGRHKNAVL